MLNEIEQEIKNKIERLGKPLKEWDIQINYGIKTGYNEAFIIDENKRIELIEKCPKAVEIIRPLLNGNAIRKYDINFGGQYLINSHNGFKTDNLKPIDLINDYPGIYTHIISVLHKIDNGQIKRKRGHTNNNSNFYERSDKGVSPFNLRSCTYLKKFESPKIIWKQTSSERTFTFDNSGFYLDVTGQMLTHNFNDSVELKYILAILNSKLIDYYIRTIATSFGGQGIRWIPQFIEIIPIVLESKECMAILSNLVDEIQINLKKNEKILILENQIDKFIFDIYGVTSEEAEFINSSSSNVKFNIE